MVKNKKSKTYKPNQLSCHLSSLPILLFRVDKKRKNCFFHIINMNFLIYKNVDKPILSDYPQFRKSSVLCGFL